MSNKWKSLKKALNFIDVNAKKLGSESHKSSMKNKGAESSPAIALRKPENGRS
jgi:hypothetical protein